MPTKVIMPQMGESIFEGTITKWLKKIGDRIERDEPLFEISTDKVDSEIPSPAAGVLLEILVPEGQTVQINTVVAVIEGAPAADSREAAPTLSEAPGQEAPPVPPVTAPRPVAAAGPGVPVEPLPASPGARDVRTSPLVRRLAREHNIDIARIRGTGLEGRITKEDVFRHLEELGKAGVSTSAVEQPAVTGEEAGAGASTAVSPPPKTTVPQISVRQTPTPVVESLKGEETETVPMTQMRRLIAEHMVLSRRTSAHVSTVFEVDMTPIVKLRDKVKEEFEKREEIKLTFTPFIAKAVVETVREFPIFNCSVSGDAIVYKKAIHLGIAVALDNGLLVPVVRDAHLKSFTGLALAINDLAERARTKRLKPDEVQGGTISITNPGTYGALFGTPIINQPQVAILGVGGIEKRPVVVDDAIAIRSMICLSLSFDHRVIDGAVADQFMAKLKGHLQSWSQWRE